MNQPAKHSDSGDGQRRAVFAVVTAATMAAFDLTELFKDVTETVYSDSCCHFNERGNELIEAAVVDAIARTENAATAVEAP